MLKQKIRVLNPSGLHLRPAGKLCDAASGFACHVGFYYDEGRAEANAKSVLSILGACVKSGDEIELVCDGADEEEAMKTLVHLVEVGFGE